MRIGMIGAGGIARTHSKNLAELGNVSITAVSDIDHEKAIALAAQWDAHAVTDYREILDQLDAVYICTPPTTRRQQVETVASAGVPIYCEKPLATTMEDGKNITQAVHEAGIPFMVGFNHRFRKPFQRFRQILTRGELGDLVSAWVTRLGSSTQKINTNWRTTAGLSCGITIESVSHDIDFIRWSCGEPISCFGLTETSLPELAGYDNSLNAVLSLDSGAAVNLNISWASKLSIGSRGFVGTKGSAVIEGPSQWSIRKLHMSTGENQHSEVFEEPEASDFCYQEASRHFIDCVRSGRPPSIGVNDGLAALAVSIALKSSADQRQVVEVQL